MSKDLAALLRVSKDEHFVTARHCLQSLWKVGVAGEPQRNALLKGLVLRFEECTSEKNCTLIRYDILVVLRRVYDLVSDQNVQATAERLMAREETQNTGQSMLRSGGNDVLNPYSRSTA